MVVAIKKPEQLTASIDSLRLRTHLRHMRNLVKGFCMSIIVAVKRIFANAFTPDQAGSNTECRAASLDLPEVRLLETSRFLNGSFVAPNPWITVQCLRSEDSGVIGHVSCGLSPLSDRVYIGDIFVEPEYRRKGYARSMLLAVTRHCSAGAQPLPITALHEASYALSFWNNLRADKISGLTITIDVRQGDMGAEKQRWAVKSTA